MSSTTNRRDFKESDFQVVTKPSEKIAHPTSHEYWNNEKIVFHCQFDRNAEIAYNRVSGFFAATFILPLFLCYGWDFFNYRDKINSKSCFITEKNIVYREEPHLTACRVDCCYKTGLFEQVIPLSKIQEVQIKFPGRGCIERFCPVTTVKVETASNSISPDGFVRPELTITGLKDPQAFREAILKQARVFMTQNVHQELNTSQQESSYEEKKLKLLEEIRDGIQSLLEKK